MYVNDLDQSTPERGQDTVTSSLGSHTTFTMTVVATSVRNIDIVILGWNSFQDEKGKKFYVPAIRNAPEVAKAILGPGNDMYKKYFFVDNPNDKIAGMV